MRKNGQGKVFLILLGVYALSAFLMYTLFAEQLVAMVGVPLPDLGIPRHVVGMANAMIVLVIYGVLGIVGNWFAVRLDLPGIYSREGNSWRWFGKPLLIGVVCGIVLVVGDILFAEINEFGRFPHPGFPASILASISAGIGEEIAFRGFIFGLWGLILNWLFKRFNGRKLALLFANVIAALAFGAGHLGSLFYLTGVSNISEINSFLLFEVFLLNGLVGIVAGESYIKDGLVAAAGVHFWTDIVFHVIWGFI